MRDWIFKRVVKVLLKKTLSQVLATELDVDQLGLQLENGVFEMSDCLLDTSFLNSFCGDHNVKLESAFIEHIRVSISDMDVILDGVILDLQEIDPNDSPPHTGDQDVNCINSLPHLEGDGEGLQEGIHLIHDFMEYLKNGLSLGCTDIILSLHTLASEEIKCRLQGISIKKSVSSERQCSISNIEIQVLKDEQLQLMLKLHHGSISIHIEPEMKCISRVSCSTTRPISCTAVPVALDILQSVMQRFLNKVQNREKKEIHAVSKDSETLLQMSVLRELNLPMVWGLDNPGTDSMEAYGFSSFADGDVDEDRLASSVADLVSTVFFSTQQIAEEEASHGHDLGSKHESKFEAPLVKFKIYADTNSIPSGEGSDCIQTALEVQVTSVSISMSTMANSYNVEACFGDLFLTIAPKSIETMQNPQWQIFDRWNTSALSNSIILAEDELEGRVPVLVLRNTPMNGSIKIEHGVKAISGSLDLGDLCLWITPENLAMVIDICSELSPAQNEAAIDVDLEISLQVSNVKAYVSQPKTKTDALIVEMAVGSNDRPLKFLSSNQNKSLFLPLRSLCATSLTKSQTAAECLTMRGVDLQVCFEGDAWIIDVSPSTESIRATFDLFQAMEIISDACPARSLTTTSRVCFHIRMNEAKIHVLGKHGSSNLAVTCYLKNLSFRKKGRSDLTVEEMLIEVSVDSIDSFMKVPTIPSCEDNSEEKDNSVIRIEKLKIAINAGLLHREVGLRSDLCQLSMSFLEEGSCLHIMKIAISLAVSANEFRLICVDDLTAGLSNSRYLHATACRIFLDSGTINNVLQIVEDFRDEVSNYPTQTSYNQRTFSVVEECRSESRPGSIPDYCTGGFEFFPFSLEQLLIDDYVKVSDSSGTLELAPLFDLRVEKLVLEIHMEMSSENEERADSLPIADGYSKSHLELLVEHFQADLYDTPDSFYWTLSIVSAKAFFSSSSPNQWLRRVEVLDASNNRGHAVCMKLESRQNDTELLIKTSRIRLVLPLILIAFSKEFLGQINNTPESWEDLSSNSQSVCKSRYNIVCTGFPVSITFLSSKTRFKNAKNDLFLEILNLMPQWSANLWMDTVAVESSPGMSLAVNSIIPLWTQNVIDAQLHRCAIDLPGYTAMRKIAKLAAKIPTNKRPIEDIFMRFAFALAAHFTNIDENV